MSESAGVRVHNQVLNVFFGRFPKKSVHIVFTSVGCFCEFCLFVSKKALRLLN